MLTMVHSNGMADTMFAADEPAPMPAPSNGRTKDYWMAAAVVAKSALDKTKANIGKIQAAERNATLIGVGGGVVGVGVGGAVGRWAGSGNRIVTTVGGAVGAAGLGLLAFFVSRRVMLPPMRAGEVAKGAIAAASEVAGDALESTIAKNGGLGYVYTS